jgi:hypothetical protein
LQHGGAAADGVTVAGNATLDLRVNDHQGISKGTGYSITKQPRITLMSGGISAGREQKNKREREAPQSGIQMLFVVLCSLRSTGTSYARHPLRASRRV